MNRIGLFFVKRAFFIPFSLFVVITIAFALVYVMPGDPAEAIYGAFAPPEDLERVREELGLNDSFGERYVSYIGNVFQADLGASFFSQRPVKDEIFNYLPNTLELIVVSLLVASVLGIAIGTLAAYFRRRLPDRVARTVVTALQSVPDFFLGLVLIYAVFYLWGVAPGPEGRLGVLSNENTPDYTGFLLVDTLFGGHWSLFVEALHHIMLPALTLGIVYSAYFAKTARTSMSRALNSPQIEYARAAGLPERTVIRYAFLTARTPILTYGAILFGVLVGGEAVVETIFAWEGVGQWALNGVLQKDVPVIQGFILTAGVITLCVYLILDLVVLLLDPRVSYG